MPEAFVPGVARCHIRYSDAQTKWGNRLHVLAHQGQAITQADLQAIATGVAASLLNRVRGFLPNGVEMLDVEAVDLTNAQGATAQAPMNVTGSNGNAEGAAALSVCMSLHDNLHYRGGHPRIYWGGIPEASLNSSTTWNISYLNQFVAAMIQVVDDINAIAISGSALATLVSVHRTAHKIPLNPPTIYPIVGVTGDVRVCTQRRRSGRLT